VTRITVGELVASGRVALAAGDFEVARRALTAAVETGEAPAAHVMLGGVAYADDDFAEARTQWEIAFRQFRAAGELRAAARVAAELALVHASAFGNQAVGAGWLGRGRRLLDRVGRCVEQGYLALAYLAVHCPDMAAVERDAAFALELAVEFGDSDLEARALAESGFALVAQGRTREGFSLLDEAMAAITAGEVTDWSIVGKIFCAMLAACGRVGEVRRAQEWSAVVAEMLDRHRGRPRVLQAHCRVAYGALLCRVGRWQEAEATMLEALSPTASKGFHLRVDATAELANLRVLQGRLDEAATLLRPYEDRLAACGPLARLHLARGEPHLAAAVIARALRELVADRLREGPLLALLVEVEIIRGDIDAACHAAEHLAHVAADVEGANLRAEAALAAGRVAAARADHQAALAHLQEAQRLLAGEEPPLLSGLIRLELAQAMAGAVGKVAAIGEARAALSVFERLGASPYADRTAAVLRSLGDTERRRALAPSAAVGSLSRRESEVLDLLRQGLTNAQIAERLYISAKTAEHHVSRVLTKLGVRSRAEAVALAFTGSREPLPVPK